MGLATAKILGRDRHVVVSDVSEARLAAAVTELRELRIDATTVLCDVTDRSSVEALVECAQRLGRVSSVVHAAGVSPQMGAPDMIIRVNAVGTVHVADAFFRIAGEGFALVNVASVAGHMLPAFLAPSRVYKLALSDVGAFATQLIRKSARGPAKLRPGRAYALSKNFVVWYSKAVAPSFGARNARVLSVSPGSFDTSMGRLEAKSGSSKLVEFAAIKRFGKPEEVAELLAFCASDKPGYLTGVDILCDGGTMAHLGITGRLQLALAAR
jgi:NAD(P)-dependent dehydrogenase (short-subunit alcohol dehydrogenase family)